MSVNLRRAGWIPFLLWSLALCAGCESPKWIHNLNSSFLGSPRPSAAAEESYRKKYVADRDPAAQRWLLSNCIETGMTYADVCRVMGETGEREEFSQKLSTGSGNYQVGDEFYVFGPNKMGTSVYLAFRNGTLVNFNPDEFQDEPADRK
jgi:hypothetical protein